MKLRRMVSCMMALLLVCSLPLAAFAEEYDLANGSITVTANTDGQTVNQGGTDHTETSPTVIKQSDSSTPTTNTITITVTENATANVTIQDVNIVVSEDAPTGHSNKAAVTIDVADNAESNVTLKDVNIDVGGTGGYDSLFGITYTGEAAVQITGSGDVAMELDGDNTVQGGNERAGVEKNNGGNLTITDENGTHGSLKATGGDVGSGIGGGFYSTGSNITISGSADVTAIGGTEGSGIGGGQYSSGSSITITDRANVTAIGGWGAAGIGGGYGGSGSDITISGSAEVTAIGGDCGTGIGGGGRSTGSNITVSGDAQVKAQGGDSFVMQTNGSITGAGAAIGNGGTYQVGATDAESLKGDEVNPNTSKLTPNGKIEYYAPGAEIKTADPTKTVTGTYVPPQPTEPAQPAAPYRVVGQDGKNLACKKAQSSGVLTITVDADFATLTGSASGLKTLKAQGVETIVFVTTGATSTFALADLLAQVPSGSTYALTHVGSTVTLTLSSGMDISSILK